MRRTTATLSLLLFALFLAPGASSVMVATPEPEILRLPIDGVLPVEPTHVPTPETNVGIGPGAHLFITIPDEGSFACTANFVWEAAGKTYLGAAGHCFLPGDKTATHGPGADYDASDVVVQVCVYGCSFGGQSGFFLIGNLVTLGEVAYARQTENGDAVGNDFGIVEIPDDLLSQVRPTLPVWGGPTTMTPARSNGPVCVYGNGVLVAETFATMARMGVGVGQFDATGDWQAALNSNSGDSGSALITCANEGTGWHGVAPVGVLTHGIGVGVTVPALAFGTTIAKAKLMATQANLAIELVI